MPKVPTEEGGAICQSLQGRSAKSSPSLTPLEEKMKDKINNLAPGLPSAPPDAAKSEHSTALTVIPEQSQKPAKEAKTRKEKTAQEKSEGSKVWEAFAEAVRQRTGQVPMRNAKRSTQAMNVAQRLGQDAPLVAAFFGRYAHDFDYFTAKCEKICDDWKLKIAPTKTAQIQADRDATARANGSIAVANYLAKRGIPHV
jgi:hypothetical protein